MMQLDDLMFDVRLDLEQLGPLAPGRTALVPIRFLDPEAARSHCSTGTSFVLREAGPIGEGFVKEAAFLHLAT